MSLDSSIFECMPRERLVGGEIIEAMPVVVAGEGKNQGRLLVGYVGSETGLVAIPLPKPRFIGAYRAMKLIDASTNLSPDVVVNAGITGNQPIYPDEAFDATLFMAKHLGDRNVGEGSRITREILQQVPLDLENSIIRGLRRGVRHDPQEIVNELSYGRLPDTRFTRALAEGRVITEVEGVEGLELLGAQPYAGLQQVIGKIKDGHFGDMGRYFFNTFEHEREGISRGAAFLTHETQEYLIESRIVLDDRRKANLALIAYAENSGERRLMLTINHQNSVYDRASICQTSKTPASDQEYDAAILWKSGDDKPELDIKKAYARKVAERVMGTLEKEIDD